MTAKDKINNNNRIKFSKLAVTFFVFKKTAVKYPIKGAEINNLNCTHKSIHSKYLEFIDKTIKLIANE